MELGYDPPAQFRTALDQLHATVAAELGTDDFGPGGAGDPLNEGNPGFEAPPPLARDAAAIYAP